MASTNGTAAKNGHRPSDSTVRVAIVGVGNCASSLVQGRFHYADAKDGDFIPGLMHVNLGGYHVRDIEIVAAFDVDKNKVGKDLSEAIYTKPNNTYVFQKVEPMGVTVERGMTHDGLGKYLSQIIEKAPGPTADIVGILQEREVDVMVSFAVRRLQRLLYAIHLKRGTHDERHDVQTMRATRVEITGASFTCNADGELAGPMTRRRWELKAGAFTMMLPTSEQAEIAD